MFKIARDCDKLLKVIESCVTDEQLDTAKEMAYNFSDIYNLDTDESTEPYADVINDTVEEKMEELCQNAERPIGFLR